MANTTKVQAIQLVSDALSKGAVFNLKVAAGQITCGPIHFAQGPKMFGCYVYGKGRWARPDGLPTGHGSAQSAAATLVEYAGRGAAAKAARAYILALTS